MRVRDLKNLLESASDDAIVVRPGRDHSFEIASVCLASVLYDSEHRCLTEDHGEDVTPEAEYGKRVPALIVG